MKVSTIKGATFLGDGVYALTEGGMIKLFTHDGYNITNVVYLEPEVYDALQQYAHTLWPHKAEAPEKT